MQSQRSKYVKGTISDDHIETLESIPCWVWSVTESEYEDHLSELKEYVSTHGHARVPREYKSATGFRLGGWVSHRREDFRKGNLSPNKIKDFEAIIGWDW